MTSLSDETAADRLLPLHRYLAFDLPRTTTAAGVLSVLGLAGVHLYVLLGQDRLPIYLQAGFALLMACCVVSAVLMVWMPRPAMVRIGWALGALTSAVFLIAYVISRLAGLPELPELQGWWDNAPGTIAGVCALMVFTLIAAIALGITVASPWQRDWHD